MATPQKEPSDRCTWVIPKTGERCKNGSIKGSMVCTVHGGRFPNVKAAAKVRLARDKAQQEALARLKARSADRVETITEMDRLAAEVIVFKDVVRERLDELMALGDIRYEGKTGEQLRAEVALYERALDRCNAVLATNIKLGIAERKQRLNEAEAMVIVTLIRELLDELHLSADQKRMAAELVPVKLRAISGPAS